MIERREGAAGGGTFGATFVPQVFTGVDATRISL